MDRSIYQFDDLPQQDRHAPIERAPAEPIKANRLVGVVRNPRSYRNKSRDPHIADRENVILAEPEDRDELPAVLADFARKNVHYLVIDGGDGTIRDVLTAGAGVFGDEWPRLAVLPSGKTNALAADLGMPASWDLAHVLDAIETGGRIERNPIIVRPADGRSGLVQGFLLGGGIFADATEAGQEAHRWGAFNSVVVVVAAIWAVLRAFFGRKNDPYRRGVPLALRLWPGGKPLRRSKFGEATHRFILLSSTLERLPIGLKPFGSLREGLRIVVMDKPRRRLLSLLPIIAFGWHNVWLERAGVHREWCDEFEMDTGTRFILDGEAFPPGLYRVSLGPRLRFVAP